MKTKHTSPPRRARKAKRQAAADAAAEAYWRGKLAEYEECVDRLVAIMRGEWRPDAVEADKFFVELDGWRDLMEEIGIF